MFGLTRLYKRLFLARIGEILNGARRCHEFCSGFGDSKHHLDFAAIVALAGERNRCLADILVIRVSWSTAEKTMDLVSARKNTALSAYSPAKASSGAPVPATVFTSSRR